MDKRAKTSAKNGAKGGRPRAARVTLRFRRFFLGEEKGTYEKTIALTSKAIVSEAGKNMGGGWGCRVVMDRDQIAAVGGRQTEFGFALDHGFDFVEVI